MILALKLTINGLMVLLMITLTGKVDNRTTGIDKNIASIYTGEETGMTTIVSTNIHTSARHITVGAYTFPSSFFKFYRLFYNHVKIHISDAKFTLREKNS